MANVDVKTAAIVLDRALVEAKSVQNKTGRLIDGILTGNHKTYKYVLVTALLAKATNDQIDPLSLQVGDGNGGKYDARSLCHKVVVPFETMKLPGSLGNSNEPYLNKPARFQTLSMNNAVRAGRDRQTLQDLITILSKINSSKVAYKYLKSALYRMKANHDEYIAKYSVGDIVLDISEFSQLVLDYIYEITDHTMEGEVCPLIVAELEKMTLGNCYDVRPHKVNESGSSSKEVGDIDVYKDDTLCYSIEVKDKDFTEQDVRHAINKFRAANLNVSYFIYGKNVSFDEDAIFTALKEIGREGHYCCLISILNFAKLRIADLKAITIKDFVTGLLNFSKAINAKDDTIEIIKDIAKRIFY